MARILLVYGTTDGHTAKIAQSIAETLRVHGSDVDVVEAGKAASRLEGYAGVIVAASVHAGGYQRSVRSWVRSNAWALARKPTAFVSVCLGVLQRDPTVQREVAGNVERFLTETGWRPTFTKIVAGALLYTRYTWIKRWVMKRIVRKAGGDTDTSQDYVYTDWADLHAFVEQFERRVFEAKVA